MEKLKYIKIEDEEGNLSDNVPIGANAENIDMANGNNLETELANINQDLDNKNISINNLQNKDIELNEKINNNTNSLQNKINSLDEKNNSNNNNLQNQINSLASGSPYTANSIDEMTDTTRIYVNTTDGHWYYYSQDSWNDGGVYQATEIADGTITPRKTNFYEKTINIRDISIENIGIGINNITGENYENSSLRSSNFIKIDKAETIGIQVFQDNMEPTYIKFYFYNNDKSYISSIELIFPSDNDNIEIPLNTMYVKYEMNNLYSNRIINITLPYTKLSTYLEPYIFKDIKDIEKQINNIKNGSDLNNESIKPEKTTFFNIISNLINKSKMKVGAILGDTGNFDSSFEDYNATEYIYVKKGENYFLSNNGTKISEFTGALYNEDKIYLKQINNTNPFIPEENGYCRISTRVSPEKLQLQTNKITNYIDYNNPQALLKDEYIPICNYKNKKILILGDSITALDMGNTGWVKYFSNTVEPSIKINVAVAGATWKDKVVNQAYDGNPQPSTEGNVIGNQVQKVINEKNSNNNDYKDFDIIIIAAGTNDTPAEEIDTVENEFISNYNTDNYTIVPLENVNRMTFAGAMRYTYEKLNELYPNAKIVVCTPLQECMESFDSIYKKGKLIEYIASRLSIICWNLRDCGILNIYERPGEDCRDLIDGIHPNASGAKKIGEYISREFKKLFI